MGEYQDRFRADWGGGPQTRSSGGYNGDRREARDWARRGGAALNLLGLVAPEAEESIGEGVRGAAYVAGNLGVIGGDRRTVAYAREFGREGGRHDRQGHRRHTARDRYEQRRDRYEADQTARAEREGGQIADRLAPLIEDIINAPDEATRAEAMRQYQDAAASYTGGEGERFLIGRRESIRINGRDIFLPPGAADAEGLLDFALRRTQRVDPAPESGRAPAPDTGRTGDPAPEGSRPTPAPAPTPNFTGDDVTLTAGQTIDGTLARQILNAPHVREGDRELTPGQRLNRVLEAGLAQMGTTPENIRASWLMGLMSGQADAQTANNINALYAQATDEEKATYRQQMEAAIERIATTLPEAEREAFREQARAAMNPERQNPGQGQDGTQGPQGPQQSFMDMLSEFFTTLIQAIERALGNPQQTAPGQGTDTASPAPGDGSAQPAPGGNDGTQPSAAPVQAAPAPVNDTLANQVALLGFGADGAGPDSTTRSNAVESIVNAAMARDSVQGGSVNGGIDTAERSYFQALDRAFDSDTTDTVGLNSAEQRAFKEALEQARAQGVTAAQFVSALHDVSDETQASGTQLVQLAMERARAGQAPSQ